MAPLPPPALLAAANATDLPPAPAGPALPCVFETDAVRLPRPEAAPSALPRAAACAAMSLVFSSPVLFSAAFGSPRFW